MENDLRKDLAGDKANTHSIGSNQTVVASYDFKF